MAHSVLGSLLWEPNEREWRGTCNGLVFSIPQEKQTVPSAELLNYAATLLARKEELLLTLASAKQQWISKYPETAHEVMPLHFDEFALFRYKGACKAFVILAPEYPRNAWRIQFDGLTCQGLGFDS